MFAISTYKRKKAKLAELFGADERELKALGKFIAYKEKCVKRTQHVEENLHAIEKVQWLIKYLKNFPL